MQRKKRERKERLGCEKSVRRKREGRDLITSLSVRKWKDSQFLSFDPFHWELHTSNVRRERNRGTRAFFLLFTMFRPWLTHSRDASLSCWNRMNRLTPSFSSSSSSSWSSFTEKEVSLLHFLHVLHNNKGHRGEKIESFLPPLILFPHIMRQVFFDCVSRTKDWKKRRMNTRNSSDNMSDKNEYTFFSPHTSSFFPLLLVLMMKRMK